MSSGKTVTLSSGHKIPQVGFGTWQSAPGEVGNAVYEALKAGYRHLDLAKIYENQKEVAQGIKKAYADVPGLKREDIFITSKLWNNSHRPENVPAALDDTLAELELDYLDLYLIHWPLAFAPGNALAPQKPGDPTSRDIDQSVTISQTWKAMTELPKSKVRSVGVSNFKPEDIDAVVKATGVWPAVNQVERHPRLVQKDLVEYAAKNSIHLTAYSGFGNNNVGITLLINEPEVKAIADRLGKAQGKTVTPAQLLIAWGQIGGHSIIPKSVTPQRIRDNFQEVELDEEAIKALDKFAENPHRFNVPATYTPAKWEINIWDDPKETQHSHRPLH